MTPLSTVLPRMRFCLRYIPSTAEGTPLPSPTPNPSSEPLVMDAGATGATARDLLSHEPH